MLEDGTLFPGCKTVDWSPVPRKLTGKVKKAVDYLVRDARTIIKFSDVFRALEMTRMDFNNERIPPFRVRGGTCRARY